MCKVFNFGMKPQTEQTTKSSTQKSEVSQKDSDNSRSISPVLGNRFAPKQDTPVTHSVRRIHRRLEQSPAAKSQGSSLLSFSRDNPNEICRENQSNSPVRAAYRSVRICFRLHKDPRLNLVQPRWNSRSTESSDSGFVDAAIHRVQYWGRSWDCEGFECHGRLIGEVLHHQRGAASSRDFRSTGGPPRCRRIRSRLAVEVRFSISAEMGTSCRANEPCRIVREVSR